MELKYAQFLKVRYNSLPEMKQGLEDLKIEIDNTPSITKEMAQIRKQAIKNLEAKLTAVKPVKSECTKQEIKKGMEIENKNLRTRLIETLSKLNTLRPSTADKSDSNSFLGIALFTIVFLMYIRAMCFKPKRSYRDSDRFRY